MDEMPSSLRTLICAGWSPSTPLPASLTHLELSCATSTSFLSNLPSSLTFLSLPKTPLTDFPTHLQQLESLTCQWKNTWEKLSELPKSLLKLKLLEELSWTSSAPTSSLPPGLTSLEMDNLPTQYWSYLPLALKSLDIRKDPTNDFFRELKRPEKTRQVATYPLENLPKSLLRLSIGFRFDFKNPHHLCAPSESVSSPSKELLFPPSLQYLRISSMPMSVEAGKQLPRSLTFLSTSFLHNAICEHLPRGLLELEANSCAVNQDFIKLLPKSITKLHLGFIDPTTRWYVMGTGTTSNTEVLFGIAEEAMQQTFQDFWEFESCFSNLCKLSLSGCTISMNGLFSEHAKFGRLEKLALDRCRFNTSLIQQLPQHLLEFSVTDTDCTSSSFKDLPRSIQALKLYSTGPVANEDFAYLPPGLETLAMHSPDINDSCIKLLPLTLKCVDFYDDHISSKVISSLSPLLRFTGIESTFSTTNWGLHYGQINAYDDEEL